MSQVDVKREYSAGESVPDPGIYRVVHYQHRMPHLVTFSPETTVFPDCNYCGSRVCFEPMFPVTGNHPAAKAKEFAPPFAEDYDFKKK